jgi:hypothetical protein
MAKSNTPLPRAQCMPNTPRNLGAIGVVIVPPHDAQ